MPTSRNESKSERGQSMVEFAFGFVVLLLLLSGAVDGGRALFTYMALRDSAQEGALYGSTNPTQTNEIVTRVKQSSDILQSLSSQDPTHLKVEVLVSGDGCTGDAITVKVTYSNFQITMPLLGGFVGSQSIGISSSVTDTILTPACQ
jgi:Flp pilus assembly protein TadG